MTYKVILSYTVTVDDVQDANEAIKKARYTVATIPEIVPTEIQVNHVKRGDE